MDIYIILTFVTIVFILVVGAMKRSQLTFAIAIGLFIIFFLEIISKSLAFELAFRPIYLTSQDNLYTIITSMFAHSSFFHIVGNVIFLFLLGTALESRIGKARFAAVYFVSGIVATLFAGLIFLQTTPNIFLLGASGAISGLVGALLVLYPNDEIPMIIWIIFLPKVKVIWAAASWFIFSVLLVFIGDLYGSSGISWEAHVGGFLAGILIGWGLGRSLVTRKGSKSSEPKFYKLEPLAVTLELRNALEMIKKETNPEVRKAWLEYFAERATCPNCQARMVLRGNKLICPCAFEIDLR